MGEQRSALLFFNGTFVFSENGAHARTAELLDFLRGEFAKVIVYSYRNHPTCPWTEAAQSIFRERYPDVPLVLEDQTGALKLLMRSRNAGLQLVPAQAQRWLRWLPQPLAPRFRQLLRTHPDLTLFVSYVDGISQLPNLPASTLTVLEAHDLKFLNYALAREQWVGGVRVLAKLRGELAALRNIDAVVAISPFESDLYAALSPETKVFYIPSYAVSAAPAALMNEPEFRPEFRYDMLFVGSENTLNVKGILEFLQLHEAWLRDRVVALCGRVCTDPSIVAFAETHPSIQLLGYVDDLAQVHAHSRICLAPVAGTGLKIKILDALRFSRPVLASRSAIIGLPSGYDTSVFPLDVQHAEKLLHDHDHWRAASRAAHAYSNTLGQRGDLDAFRAYLGDAR